VASVGECGRRGACVAGVDRFNIRDERMYQGQVYWDTRRVAEQVAEAARRATERRAAVS
jgi:hypothetical protein